MSIITLEFKIHYTSNKPKSLKLINSHFPRWCQFCLCLFSSESQSFALSFLLRQRKFLSCPLLQWWDDPSKSLFILYVLRPIFTDIDIDPSPGFVSLMVSSELCPEDAAIRANILPATGHHIACDMWHVEIVTNAVTTCLPRGVKYPDWVCLVPSGSE